MTIGYANGSLHVAIVDVGEPHRRWTQVFPLDLPSQVGGPMAYAGFTASTSGTGVTTEVLMWTWLPGVRP